MGKKSKFFLTLLLIFAATTLLAFYFEEYFRSFVRYFIKYFSNNKIQFVGKNFHLFASNYFVISSGVFCVIFIKLIKEKTLKSIFSNIFILINLFLATTITLSYIISLIKITECTACDDGIRKLQYNAINYDSVFITSLVVSLIPLIIFKIKKNLRISGK